MDTNDNAPAGDVGVARNRAVEVYAQHIRPLPVAEQLRLMALIAQGLEIRAGETALKPERGIMELYGAARGRGVGMDAQEYVNRLREGRSLPSDES